MTTENSKTSEAHIFRLNLTDKLSLKDPNKNIVLANLIIYYTWKNIKPKYKNNEYKVSAPTCNNWFDLPDRFSSISHIQLYFESIIKKHENLTEYPSIEIYVSRVKNRIVFKTKAGYKWELLTPGTMKLLRSTKKDVDKDKDGVNAPKLESFEVVLVQCRLIKNDYQHTSKVLFIFVTFVMYLELILNFPLLKSGLQIEIEALEIEDNDNLTHWVNIKMKYSTQPKYRKFVKGYGFLSFARNFGDKNGKKLMDGWKKNSW